MPEPQDLEPIRDRLAGLETTIQENYEATLAELAKDDVPSLIDEVERLRAALEMVRDEAIAGATFPGNYRQLLGTLQQVRATADEVLPRLPIAIA